MTTKRLVLVVTIFCAAFTGNQGLADEIKCLFPIVLTSSVTDLIPKFEKSTGHTVKAEFAVIAPITDRIRNGEVADVAVLSDVQIDQLMQEGKIAAGSRTNIGMLGVGAFTRKDAPRPALGSVDAFSATVRAAKGIVYINPTNGDPSGIHMSRLLERLGLAAEVKPKTILTPPNRRLFDAVLSGRADVGFTMIAEILAEPSVAYAGPLPAELQGYTKYVGGMVASGKQTEASRGLLAFLASPDAIAALKAKGFEPF